MVKEYIYGKKEKDMKVNFYMVKSMEMELSITIIGNLIFPPK